MPFKSFYLDLCGKLRVGPGYEGRHGSPAAGVGDGGVEVAAADVIAELGPVALEECDGAEEGGGEDGA